MLRKLLQGYAPVAPDAVAFIAVWLPARRASRIDPSSRCAPSKDVHADCVQPDCRIDRVRVARRGFRPSPVGRPASAAASEIGLALGGGSARGLAHVGVLEWFEEHRIPIDYIAGTSMGGLVAGAYATG